MKKILKRQTDENSTKGNEEGKKVSFLKNAFSLTSNKAQSPGIVLRRVFLKRLQKQSELNSEEIEVIERFGAKVKVKLMNCARHRTLMVNVKNVRYEDDTRWDGKEDDPEEEEANLQKLHDEMSRARQGTGAHVLALHARDSVEENKELADLIELAKEMSAKVEKEEAFAKGEVVALAKQISGALHGHAEKPNDSDDEIDAPTELHIKIDVQGHKVLHGDVDIECIFQMFDTDIRDKADRSLFKEELVLEIAHAVDCSQKHIKVLWVYKLKEPFFEFFEGYVCARIRLLEGAGRHRRSVADVAKALWSQQLDSQSLLSKGTHGSKLGSLHVLLDPRDHKDQLTVSGLTEEHCKPRHLVDKLRQRDLEKLMDELESRNLKHLAPGVLVAKMREFEAQRELAESMKEEMETVQEEMGKYVAAKDAAEQADAAAKRDPQNKELQAAAKTAKAAADQAKAAADAAAASARDNARRRKAAKDAGTAVAEAASAAFSRLFTATPNCGRPGIGVVIGRSDANDVTQPVTILKVAPGGSAHRSGNVGEGDELLAVDDLQCLGRELTEISSRIIGPSGSFVELKMKKRDPKPATVLEWLQIGEGACWVVKLKRGVPDAGNDGEKDAAERGGGKNAADEQNKERPMPRLPRLSEIRDEQRCGTQGSDRMPQCGAGFAAPVTPHTPHLVLAQDGQMSFEPANRLGFDAPHILGFAVAKQIELEQLALRRTAEEAHKKASEAEEARRKAEAKKAAVTAAESARLKAAEEARLKTAQEAQRRASVQAFCATPKSVTPPQGATDTQELNRQSLLPPSLPPLGQTAVMAVEQKAGSAFETRPVDSGVMDLPGNGPKGLRSGTSVEPHTQPNSSTSMPARLPEKPVEMALKLGLDFSKAGQPASPQVAYCLFKSLCCICA